MEYESTQKVKNGIFKFIHPREHLLKVLFSLAKNSISVWTKGQNVEKNMPFQPYLDSC